MFRSALIKLTLYYVGLAMLLSLLFSVVMYHFATYELREGLNRQYSELVIKQKDNETNGIYNAGEYNKRANQLLVDFVYFNLVVLGLSAGASYALARRTLKPIRIAHQAQSRFASLASHELRSPLAAMRADTESILMINPQPSPPELVKTLKSNLADIKRIERLANQLLQLARLQSAQTVNFQDFDLIRLIRSNITQARRAGQRFNIKISMHSPPPQLVISADKFGLDLLISALLDNAVKYNNRGGKVDVTVKLLGSAQAMLEISDNGQGIDNKDRPYVFEPFYRSSAKSRTGGSGANGYGLGLSLVKEIVDAHHGTIKLDSQPGKGTTVSVYLPRNNRTR